MEDNRLFGNIIDTAAKALDLRSRRHEVIISNLANADTPGYKAFDLLVDESMANKAHPQNAVGLTQTHPGHIPGVPPQGKHLQPRIVQTPEPNNLRGDGNTVDMDREMAGLAENQLMYKAAAQILAKKFADLKYVIKGGK